MNDKAVFIEVDIVPELNCVKANWKGVLETEDVTQGALALIDELKSTGYRKILNDNRQVIGDWRPANEWLAKEWMPLVMKTKLEKFAHILSPYYYDKLSAEELLDKVDGRFKMQIFKKEEDALNWLKK